MGLAPKKITEIAQTPLLGGITPTFSTSIGNALPGGNCLIADQLLMFSESQTHEPGGFGKTFILGSRGLSY
jgi:hypothetical protein